jgi:ribonuclease HI
LDRLVIEIYTDGSGHPGSKTGAWAAILLLNGEKVILTGTAQNTTHNRMELTAVIKAIEFIDKKWKGASLKVYTDSQYVHHIPERIEKLKDNKYFTKKGTLIQNTDLVKALISLIETDTIEFIKVEAHQQSQNYTKDPSAAYNREVDKLARKMLRKH